MRNAQFLDIDKEVGGFHIPVDNPDAVHGFQTAQHLRARGARHPRHVTHRSDQPRAHRITACHTDQHHTRHPTRHGESTDAYLQPHEHDRPPGKAASRLSPLQLRHIQRHTLHDQARSTLRLCVSPAMRNHSHSFAVTMRSVWGAIPVPHIHSHTVTATQSQPQPYRRAYYDQTYAT